MRKLTTLLLLLIGCSIASFAQEDETEPSIDYGNAIQDEETVSDEPDSTWAGISFDKQTHNYGSLPFNGDGTCEFTFTNTGTGPLILNDVKSTCGCTVPEWPHDIIKPGKSAKIKVVYNTKRSGSFTKGITVTCNAKGNETVRLIIKGEVAPQPDKPVLGE